MNSFFYNQNLRTTWQYGNYHTFQLSTKGIQCSSGNFEVKILHTSVGEAPIANASDLASQVKYLTTAILMGNELIRACQVHDRGSACMEFPPTSFNG